jgi:hypothetical protein
VVAGAQVAQHGVDDPRGLGGRAEDLVRDHRGTVARRSGRTRGHVPFRG